MSLDNLVYSPEICCRFSLYGLTIHTRTSSAHDRNNNKNHSWLNQDWRLTETLKFSQILHHAVVCVLAWGNWLLILGWLSDSNRDMGDLCCKEQWTWVSLMSFNNLRLSCQNIQHAWIQFHARITWREPENYPECTVKAVNTDDMAVIRFQIAQSQCGFAIGECWAFSTAVLLLIGTT